MLHKYHESNLDISQYMSGFTGLLSCFFACARGLSRILKQLLKQNNTREFPVAGTYESV